MIDPTKLIEEAREFSKALNSTGKVYGMVARLTDALEESWDGWKNSNSNCETLRESRREWQLKADRLQKERDDVIRSWKAERDAAARAERERDTAKEALRQSEKDRCRLKAEKQRAEDWSTALEKRLTTTGKERDELRETVKRCADEIASMSGEKSAWDFDDEIYPRFEFLFWPELTPEQKAANREHNLEGK